MPFDRPTLSELIDRVRGDIKGRLGITGELVRRAMANVLAEVFAGAAHEVHGHIAWVALQLFADTASEEYLLRIASLYGIAPTPATFASGTVTATGTDPAVIPSGTVLVRDDGATYSTTAEATLSGGTASIPVTADLAGADGNLDTGETLTLESPITDVDSTMTVESPGLSGGNDQETVEALRARLIQRLQSPPAGGKEQDYIAWALAVAGVTRAWVYAHENGLGTVTVRFVRDGDVSIFPDVAEVAAVQAALDDQRPIVAEVTAAAPVQLSVAFTISITPDTTATRAAVQAELEDMIFRLAEPGDGAGRGTIALSQMLVAIGVADGVTDFTLTAPVADVVPAVGELAVVGTITWV